MKKYHFCVFILAVLFAFVSCGDGSSKVQEQLPTGDNIGTITISGMSDILYDMSVFSHLKANIGQNTEAIGLQKVASASSSRGLDSYLDSFSDSVIVKKDSGEEAVPIEFEVVSNTGENGSQLVGFDGKKLNNGDIITQGIIPSKVDKLYVSGDFTFVSYLTVDAMKLMNSVNAQEQRDGNGNIYYQGNEHFNYDTGNNGGRNENIWWSFCPNNNWGDSGDKAFQIGYGSNIWWRDSDGNYHETSKNYNESLFMRDLSGKKIAVNESEGVLMYDVNGYYSSDFRKSYIIDNTTGLIYELPKELNVSVHRGVAIDSTLGPIDLIPQEDGSLKLEQMISNNKVAIGDVFKDNYGQVFIFNDSINGRDGNIQFYTNRGEYVPAEDGRVIHISYGSTTYTHTCNVTSVGMIGEGFSETPVGKDEEIEINYLTYLENYWTDAPEALRKYNEKNGSSNILCDNTEYAYQSSHMILEINNGKMYSMYNMWDNNFGCLDLESFEYYIYRNWNHNKIDYSTYLDDGAILTAKKDGSNSLFTIGWVPLEEFPLSELSVLYKDGNKTWKGDSNDFGSFKLKYMNPVATSIENNPVLRNKYPDCTWEYKEYLEGERTVETYDRDYHFYRKKIIGSSFGPNEEMEQISDAYDKSSEKEYRENIEGDTALDYTYSWYSVDEKEGIGYNKECDDLGYTYSIISYEEESRKSNYVPVRHLPGYPSSGYAYYSSEGELLGALSYIDTNYYPNTASYRYYCNWVYFPEAIITTDYRYRWTKEYPAGETFGFDPTKEAQGLKYRTSFQKIPGIPKYLYDHVYTYYTKEDIVTRFGSYRDSDWGDDVFGEGVDNNYRWGYCTYNYKGGGNIYTYYDYKDGYDEETVKKMFDGRQTADSTDIIGDINVSDTTFRLKRGLGIDLKKNTASSITSYRIVKTADGYEAVESGIVESSKSSIVLQPINRK